MLNRRKAFSLLGGAAVAAPVAASALPADPKPVSVALDVRGAGMTASEIMNLGDKLAREIAAAQAKAMARAAGARSSEGVDLDELAESMGQPRWWVGRK